MSLSKQLLLLLSALFLMIFTVNFVLSVNNIRDYLESEAEVHVQDTATSLGLSLSPHMSNETDPVIETMMKAIFDTGYYQEIKLLNVESQPLVTLTNTETIVGVPDWFINAIKMKTVTAESEINSGWVISGVVYVSLNSSNGYIKLYQQAKNSFYLSLVTFVVAIVLLLLLLRVTLSPLRKIEQMAIAIADGKFETINPLPWSTEVRHVTSSMNMMSNKIELATTALNLKLEGIGKKLQQDELTGLNKKSSFQIEMKKLFLLDKAEDTYIVMIKIDSLAALVKELGSDAIDIFLKDFASILTNTAASNQDGDVLVYRFVGSEFVMLAKDFKLIEVEQLAHTLSQSFRALGGKYNKPDLTHIGVVAFDSIGTTESNLFAVREAYEQAQLIGENSYHVREEKAPAFGITEWKKLVYSTVDNHTYKVDFIASVENFSSQQVIMKEALTQVFDENNKQLSIATFISIAEKFEKIVELDKGIILKVVDYIEQQQPKYAIAINVSTRTIKNSDFRRWLQILVKNKPGTSQRLIFSLSAYAIAKDFRSYKEFIEFSHKLNMKVMIKRFETESLSADLAKQLNPDYIRLARSLGAGITNDLSKQDFVLVMKDLGDLLNINVLAENIDSDEDFSCIKAIGITGASR